MGAIAADLDLSQLTPAEYAWLRPRHASACVLDRLRWLVSSDADELLADAAPLSAEEIECLLWQLERLAREFGVIETYTEETQRVEGAAIAAYDLELRSRANQLGIEYPVWNGPGYDQWERLFRLVRLHTGSLILDDLLPRSVLAQVRVPGLPVELI